MTPPGWYPDGAGQTRFWDGAEWTPYTSIPAFDAIGRSDPSVLAPPTDAALAAVLVPAVWPAPTAAQVQSGIGVAGFVVGLVAVFLPFLLGLVVGLVGLALSIAGAAQPGRAHGLAVAGIVVGILAIVLIL